MLHLSLPDEMVSSGYSLFAIDTRLEISSIKRVTNKHQYVFKIKKPIVFAELWMNLNEPFFHELYIVK